MRIFFGIIIGLVVAVAIAAVAAKYAFGNLSDIGGRDKSEDVTQVLELSGFDRIGVGGVFELDVTVGGDFSVVLSGSPEEIGRVEATVEEGVLQLEQPQDVEKRSWRNQGMTAKVTLPALNGLNVAGVADAMVSGVDAEIFEANLAGVGDLVLAGRCGRLDATVSGVGEIDAKALECREAEVVVSGVGSAKVFASEQAEATVGGVGSIDIYGSPERVEKNTSFLSSVKVR